MSNKKCEYCGRLLYEFEQCPCLRFLNVLIIVGLSIPVILLAIFLTRSLISLWSIR
jgi:hypothetical protein